MTEEQLAELTKLTEDFMEAKTRENESRQKRIDIEDKIAAIIKTPEEGQKTVSLGSIKLTVKRGLSYKADLEEIIAMFDAGISDGHLPLACPIKSSTRRELDIQGYKWYQKNYPDVFRSMSKHIEVKPKKVAVSIKAK
jgi:hypothetical protein